MKKLAFEGSEDAAAEPPDLPGVVTEVSRSFRVGLGRGVTERIELTVDEADDLIELDVGDGVKLWTSVEQLQDDVTAAARRGAVVNEDVIEIGSTLTFGGSTARGQVGTVIRALKLFRIDIPGEIIDFVKETIEAKVTPTFGLYRCGVTPSNQLKVVGGDDASLKSKDPLLVLLHGTASSTSTSFGGLWENDGNSRMSRLVGTYPHVLGWQHRTLSQSPIKNALELAKKLPADARLHLVSHSRGGLIGELLCRSRMDGPPFDGRDFHIFGDRDDQLADLEELNEVLSEKRFHIERFVRVACPARGTTLASRRLDRYFSVMLNVLKLTGLGANAIADGLSELLVAVIKKRTDPERLPGIEAMMPDSPLIVMLNRPERRSSADLHIVGGDLEGTALLSRLKELATNFFYREDHDLVVNTPAMFGGVPRTKLQRYWIDQGGTVDHFHYFRNASTAERIISILPASRDGGFHELMVDSGKLTEDDYQHRGIQGPAPVAIVIPGIMGSVLKVAGARVWMDFLQLAAGGMKRLSMGYAVEPGGPLDDPYKELIDFLRQTHRVVPFGYDWRDSVSQSAKRLRAVIEQELPQASQNSQPISVVAHSMGGLVFRAMMATPEGKQTWEKACNHPRSRLVMLGTPNGGSYAIAAMLLGRDPLVTRLALLDLPTGYAELLSIISSFPGVLELLPRAAPDALDLFEEVAWSDIHYNDVPQRGLFGKSAPSDKSSGVHWTTPKRMALSAAKAVRDALDRVKLDPERCVYVAGKADLTPSGMFITPNAKEGQRVVIRATPRGDGRVPWSSGIPPELEGKVWYMDAVHGDMCKMFRFFPAILDLLTTGTTSRLAKEPPREVRGLEDQEIVLPDPLPEMYPDEQSLVAAAVGGTVESKAEIETRVKVGISHGSLRYARNPVVVGHYKGDGIFSAEAALDRVLQGRLTKYYRLGIYPGQKDTAEYFANDHGQSLAELHPGAVVLGLGEFGSLTPGALTAAFVRGGLLYATRLLDKEAARDQDGTAQGGIISAALTPLLVGTATGGLNVADCVQSILRGIAEVNKRLRSLSKGDDPRLPDAPASESHPIVQITEVEFSELYEDRASQAARTLYELGRSAEFRDSFEINPVLIRKSGAERRAHYEDDPGYWRRLRIESGKDGTLKFEPLTEGARVEAFLQSTQKRAVREFLAQVKSGTATNPALSQTLFELLLPNRLKEQARDRRNLLLLLDSESASYPWELLQDGAEAQRQPLAVEAGMIRRLTVSEFRQEFKGTAASVDAFVLGDPPNDDRRFPLLKGAREEAASVAALMSSEHFQVTSLIGDDTDAFEALTALYAKPYRLIHLAGHGVFEFRPAAEGSEDREQHPATVTGMMLGNGIYLTASEIEQMRYVPEFAFINCCFLGETRGDVAAGFHRLAANLSSQLIRMGARCVIAAGWPVEDTAAKTFAGTFYDAFLKGQDFGDAVKGARMETFRKHSDSNTWGAYQCYGEPHFSLLEKDAETRRPPSPILSQSQLNLALENVIRSGASASQTQPIQATTLERLVQEIMQRREWTRSAATQSLVARAYGELGMFKEALDRYAVALTLHPAEVTLLMFEQRISYQLRWAKQLRRTGADSPDLENADRVKELLTGAEKDADLLLKFGPTAKRFSTKGKVHKTLSIFARSNSERREQLAKMAAAYSSAMAAVDPKDQDFSSVESLALLNWLSAQFLLSLGAGRSSKRGTSSEDEGAQRIGTALHRFDELVKSLPRQDRSFRSVWLRRVGVVLRGINEGSISEAGQNEILKGIEVARMTDTSRRELNAAAEHIEFLAELAEHLSQRTNLGADLRAIYQALGGDST